MRNRNSSHFVKDPIYLKQQNYVQVRFSQLTNYTLRSCSTVTDITIQPLGNAYQSRAHEDHCDLSAVGQSAPLR